jgi:Ca2+-binding RTX toxin-like protein
LALALLAISLAPATAGAAARCGGKKATIVGGKGRDVLRSKGRKADVIVGRGGNDRIFAGGGKDTVCAGSGDDTVSTGMGRDLVLAGAGNDYVGTGPGSDRFSGGSGADTLAGGPGGERASGGGGDDRLFGGQQDDRMRGSAGNDLLVGDHGNDDLDGEQGDDFIRGDNGTNRLDGGSGSDWISFVTMTRGSSFRRLNLWLNGTTNVAGGNEKNTGFENAVGTRFPDAFLSNGGAPVGTLRGLGWKPYPDRPQIGDSCGQTFVECPQEPALETGRPAVVLDPNPPDPGVSVIGSDGNDQFEVSRSGAGVTVRSAAPLAAGPGCTGDGTLAVTCPVSGTLGYLLAAGENGDDTVALSGSFGIATTVRLDGGYGADTLVGGPGDEMLDAGPYEYGEPPYPKDPDVLIGRGGDDALTASPYGPDRLLGGPGSDQLVAATPCGGNLLQGGPGGSDIAGFAYSRFAVKARIGGRATSRDVGVTCEASYVGASNEILEGSGGDDQLIGNNGANHLILGGPGDDVMLGLGGPDHLRGDAGKDALMGGAGVDVLEAADGEADRLDCGPGGGVARRDGRDPRAKRCGR